MMQVVVAYDISDDKRRRAVEKCLREYGIRVNYSVFECVIKKRAFEKMKNELSGMADPSDDIRIYHLCRECFGKTEVMGFREGGSTDRHRAVVHV